MIIKDGEFVDLPTPTGPMRTHVFRPVAPGRYAALLFYSEIFQVTGPIRRTAAWLASHGFVVGVPEIYHEFEPPGTVLAYDDAGSKRGNELKTAKEVAAYDSDARAALDFLKSHPGSTGKLGAIGICIGGHLAYRAATNPDVLASACFYATDLHKHGLGKGMHDDSLERSKLIQGEMLMIWGRQDPHIPTEGRRLVYDTMTAAGLHFTWHELNAQHAFMRDEGPRYDPAAAGICQQMVLEAFRRKLGEGDLRAETGPAAPAETRH
jgi:carboxymethylenebutenolidase